MTVRLIACRQITGQLLQNVLGSVFLPVPRRRCLFGIRANCSSCQSSSFFAICTCTSINTQWWVCLSFYLKRNKEFAPPLFDFLSLLVSLDLAGSLYQMRCAGLRRFLIILCLGASNSKITGGSVVFVSVDATLHNRTWYVNSLHECLCWRFKEFRLDRISFQFCKKKFCTLSKRFHY